MLQYLCCCLIGGASLHYLANDSRQYISYSENILLALSNAPDIEPAFVVRTPGYPALLALARMCALGDLRIAVLGLHALLAFVASFITIAMFERLIHPLVACAAICLLFYLCREAFSAVMTEWSIVMLLLALYASWVGHLTSRRLGWLTSGATCVTLLALIKPLFVFLIVIHFGLVVASAERNMRRRAVAIVVACFSPLFLLMSLNWARFHTFSLSPAGALSLLGVTSSIAESSVETSDTQVTRTVISHINSERLTFPASEYEAISELQATYAFRAVSQNYGSVIRLQQHLNYSWREIIAAVRLYNERVIKSNPGLYLRYLWSGVRSLKYSALLLIPAVLAPLYFIKRGSMLPVAVATSLFLFVHGAAVVITSALSIIHDRYYNVTFYPLITVAMLAGGCFVRYIIGQSAPR